jgi:hypothetical protein
VCFRVGKARAEGHHLSEPARGTTIMMITATLPGDWQPGSSSCVCMTRNPTEPRTLCCVPTKPRTLCCINVGNHEIEKCVPGARPGRVPYA